jgi:hypothetical protein
MVQEQTDPPLRIAQVQEDGALDALTPQRAPEAFDLAQGLRPPRRRHHLLDAALLQLLRERALATPGHILAAVVRQNLLGRAVRGQRRPQHLQHQGRRLAGVQAVADDEAAVVVQKSHEVDPPILPFEDKREQISLPQLIGLGPLEAARVIGVRPGGDFFHLIAGLMEHARHRGRAGRPGRAAAGR